jgi:hypothetical protein
LIYSQPDRTTRRETEAGLTNTNFRNSRECNTERDQAEAKGLRKNEIKEVSQPLNSQSSAAVGKPFRAPSDRHFKAATALPNLKHISSSSPRSMP